MTGLGPAAGQRIGLSGRLPVGAGLDEIVRHLSALGVRHLRLPLGAAEADRDAARLGMLGRRFAVMPALSGLPAAPDAAAAQVARLLDALGDATALELDPAEPAEALHAAAAAARRRGVKVALAADPAGLAGLPAGLADVVALHVLGGLDDPAPSGWDGLLAAAGGAAPTAAVWLVAGYTTWRQDPYQQLLAFRDAAGAPFARLYWHALLDEEAEERRDPRRAHFGLSTVAGAPKLLGRLLAEDGLEAVDRVASLGLPVPALATARPVLVTGGAGFIGSNLVDRLAADGHDVLVLDALARPGVDANLAWLRRRHPRRVSVALADLRDRHAVRDAAAKAEAAFHLAAQVAVTTSLGDPATDFDVNLRGTLNLIEALRQARQPAPLVFASTNKVYGDLADVTLQDAGDAYLPVDPAIRAHGIDEARPLQFHTPYGCSKGGADQYVLDAAHSFGVPAAVLRMSCIYGPRQMGTEDQGWLAHFLISVLDGRPITIYGDGRQVRDALYVDDAVAAYLGAWRRIGAVSGQAFNLGGGPDNAVTLRGVIAEIERLTNRRAEISYSDWRPGDQRYFVADARRAAAAFGLPRPVGWRDGLARLTRWLSEQRDAAPVRAPALAAGEGA